VSTEIDPEIASHGAIPDLADDRRLAVLAFAWRRIWLILVLTMGGIGGGYLYYLRQVPVFESTAKMLIVRERVKLPLGGVGTGSIYDSTHETVIRSPRVLEIARRRLPADVLAALERESEPSAVIMQNLKVKREWKDNVPYMAANRAGDIFELSYRSVRADECREILNAVFHAYRDFIGGTYERESNETIALISKAKEQLDVEIRDAKREYQEFRLAAPLLLTDENAKNIYDARLTRIEQVRAESELENRRLHAEIAAIKLSLVRGENRDALTLMIGARSEKKPGPSPAKVLPEPPASPADILRQRLLPLMLEEQSLREIYGPEHPKVKSIVSRIELSRDVILAELNSSARTAPVEIPQEPAEVDVLQVYLGSLRERIKRNEHVIGEMNKLFQEEEQNSRRLSQTQYQDELMKSAIQGKERLYDAVVARLEEISLAMENRGAHIELIFPPVDAEQVEPDLKTTLLLFGLCGILSGLGLAFVVDALDGGFHNPDEIRMDLGRPVIAHIPRLTVRRRALHLRSGADACGDLSSSLVAHYSPRGRIAEAFRKVRTALFFGGGRQQVLQVTSPSSGDGKSTVSANLAISIAHSGKRVLLIDADFRRPRVHQLFGVENDRGMSSVLTDMLDLPDAISSTSVENLWLLTCGPLPANPSELLSSARFAGLLELLREKFELVIIDTPPVLAVTDPLNVCTRVDGVLVVIRLTRNIRRTVRRALESLDGLGANIVGIVVNGVGPERGYGNDGHYQYRYAEESRDDQYYYAGDGESAGGHDWGRGDRQRG
jgi:succinoglycan biosynthesis transport protein ExoP